MRGLANAAVEGLLVCDGETVVAVNDSFGSLMGDGNRRIGRYQARDLLPRRGYPSKAVRAAERAARDGVALCRWRRNARRAHPSSGRFRRQSRTTRLRSGISGRARRRNRTSGSWPITTPLPGWPTAAASTASSIRRSKRRLAGGHPFAVLCLDLDRFKEVNDLFGHGAGEPCCRPSPDASTGMLDQDQMMARLGGDEFAIIVPGLSDPSGRRPRRRKHPRSPQGREPRLAQRSARFDAASASRFTPTTRAIGKLLLNACGHRTLPRQDRRPRHVSILRGDRWARRSRDRRHTRTRSAPRHRPRRDEARLPAAESIDTGEIVGVRGIAAMETSRRAATLLPANSYRLPKKAVHSPDRRVGAADGLPRGGELAASFDRRGKRVSRANPQRTLRPARP